MYVHVHTPDICTDHKYYTLGRHNPLADYLPLYKPALLHHLPDSSTNNTLSNGAQYSWSASTVSLQWLNLGSGAGRGRVFEG